LKTYTFSDCYALLDVDPKTFRRWLDKAGIDPEKQVSKADSRVKYLTENQIEDLALTHARPWPPLPKHDDQAQPSPGSVKLLATRVDELAAQIAGAYERIGILEALTATQAEQIATLQEQRPARRPRDQQPADAASVAGLPDDLVAWRAFADLHKASQTTTSRYIQQGFIHVVKGKWKVGVNSYVKEALDAKGRRDFWVQFHNNTGFTSCDNCPHEIPQQS